ncbi:hypothetical protein SteCoe_25463 [Stentor coeruleus]|uniref:Uncharacterized protein n=1 Tax=Stentor coeruleus TaxID=5963 RepID=A0A1R2BCM8_9CILI|nr:hypothetical protein SteCoe_26556 [Stentor coeruleus]OMJ75386.1 hypothetical protein SteCoe_25463 [Stentor coeruleus]
MGALCNNNCLSQNDEILQCDEIVSAKFGNIPDGDDIKSMCITDNSPLLILPLPPLSDNESADLKKKNGIIEEFESEYSPLPSLPLPSLTDTEPKFFFGVR